MSLTPEQLAVLEAHALKFHDSRHHIATVEKVRGLAMDVLRFNCWLKLVNKTFLPLVLYQRAAHD
jgi:hypothetical protein